MLHAPDAIPLASGAFFACATPSTEYIEHKKKPYGRLKWVPRSPTAVYICARHVGLHASPQPTKAWHF